MCIEEGKKYESKSNRGYFEYLTSLPNTVLLRTLWFVLNTELVNVAIVAVFEIPVIFN